MLSGEHALCNTFLSVHPDKPNYDSPDSYWKGFREQRVSSLEEVGEIVKSRVWSDNLWEFGRRNEASWSGSHFCVLDCDGEYPLEQAKIDWQDTQHVIVTTKSHQLPGEGDRFRVVVPWEEPITNIEVHRYNLDVLTQRYDADPCIDGARFYWPGKEVVSYARDGYKQPVKVLPDGYISTAQRNRDTAIRYAEMGSIGILPNWVNAELLAGYDLAGRNSAAYLFCRALTWLGYSDDKIATLAAKVNSRTQEPLEQWELERCIRRGVARAHKFMEKKT